jgi:hypothetical protein
MISNDSDKAVALFLNALADVFVDALSQPQSVEIEECIAHLETLVHERQEDAGLSPSDRLLVFGLRVIFEFAVRQAGES